MKIISKVSQMIERTIDMSSSRENEFFVKASTQPSLDTIMNEIKQIDRSINT